MTENHRRRRSDLWGTAIALLLMVVAVIILFVLYQQIGTQGDQIKAQSATLAAQSAALQDQTEQIKELSAKLGTSHQQLVDGCKRQTARDIEANISNRDQWVIDKIFYEATLNPIQGPQTAKEKQLTAEFIKPIKDAVNSQSWVPLTNCEVAVAVHGSHYHLPHPVPFSKRQPPKEAVTLDPGLFQ